MGLVQITVSPTGEMKLPDSLRQSLRLEDGESVLVREEEGMLVLDTVERRVAWAQEMVRQHTTPGPSVVDELIAERRAEAACE